MNERNETDIVFSYKGGIYNRPIGRGIEFVQPNGEFGIFYGGEMRDISLEAVIPEGHFEMEIVVRKKASNQS